MVSLPAYDPNAFASGIDRATWQALNTDELRPLQNRAIQGRYSPGSTFKIVVATAALEEGVMTPETKVFCAWRRPTSTAASSSATWPAATAGSTCATPSRSRATSTSTPPATCSASTRSTSGPSSWAWPAKTGIDLPNEVENIMPSTAVEAAALRRAVVSGETISVAIGQGQVSVTPMSMAVMMASVASGRAGGAAAGAGHVEGRARRGSRPRLTRVPAAPSRSSRRRCRRVHDGLWMAVNEAGTAGRARIAGRDVAGKTGTAQVISIQGRERARGSGKDLRDHGWFVFMVPRDNPELAGVIFAEHSEHGYLAAPIARHIIETYYARKEGRPLPSCRRAGCPERHRSPRAARPSAAPRPAGVARRRVGEPGRWPRPAPQRR